MHSRPVRHLLALQLVLLSAACTRTSLRVQPRYASQEISGSALVKDDALSTGAATDLEQAGLEDEGFVAGRVDLVLDFTRIVFKGQTPTFSGSGTLSAEVSDGTNTIPANSAVDTRGDLRTYDLAVLIDVLPTDMAELGLGVGAAWLDAEFSFESMGTVVETAESLPIPLVVANLVLQFGDLELAALVGGLRLSQGGDSASYLDADLSARWSFLGSGEHLQAALVLGYRRTDLELDYSDDSTDVDADLTLQGPYLGLEVVL